MSSRMLLVTLPFLWHCGGIVVVDPDASTSEVGGGGAGQGTTETSTATITATMSTSSDTSPTTTSTTVTSTSTGNDLYQESLCQCLASVSINYSKPKGEGDACTGCMLSNTTDDTDPCASAWDDCYYYLDCLNIWVDCLSGSKYDPAMIAQCILPFDKDEAHMRFKAVIDCVCPLCKDDCVYKAPMPECK